MESFFYDTFYEEITGGKTKRRYRERKQPGKCTVCGKQFNDRRAIYAHMRIHTGYKPFICEMCGKAFNQNSNLKRHIKFHLGQNKFYCEHCNKDLSLSDKYHFLEHLRSHTGEKPYACTYCDNKYSMKASLINHMKSHTKSHCFFCDICHKGFNVEGKLHNHMRIHNAEYEANKCGVCKAVFTCSSYLNDHLAKSHDIYTAYECKVCRKRFYNQTVLRNHYQDHDDHEPVITKSRSKKKRNQQGNSTISSDKLNQNEEISTVTVSKAEDAADVPSSPSYVKDVENPAQQEFLLSHDTVSHQSPCRMSQKEFGIITEGNELLETHIKSKNVCVDQIENISYDTGNEADEIPNIVTLNAEVITPTLSNCKFICGICEKEFFSEADINKHFETHRKKENVSVVQNEITSIVTENKEKVTGNVLTADTHAKTVITPDELNVLLRRGPVNHRFLCGVCGKDFGSKGEIDKHLKTHVNDEKLFMCGICKERFSSGDELKSHISNSHDI